MSISREKYLSCTTDFEPEKQDQKELHKWIHGQLADLVRIPDGKKFNNATFTSTKINDPTIFFIANVATKLPEGEGHYIPHGFKYPATILRVMFAEDSENVVTYFFNDVGQSTKNEINSGEEIEFGNLTKLTDNDYAFIRNAFTSGDLSNGRFRPTEEFKSTE